jgi:hypothetical protein
MKMNRNQQAYLFEKSLDTPALGIALLLANSALALVSLKMLGYGDYLPGFASIALSYGGIRLGLKNLRDHRLYNEKRGRLTRSNELFPLENAAEIEIQDKGGLEELMERTRATKHIEWATLLTAHERNGAAIIGFILDSKEAEKRNLIASRSFSKVRYAPDRSILQDYRGSIHMHTRTGNILSFTADSAANYHISTHDRRIFPLDWINLLTFNTSNGPEIVGYNTRYTYLPIDSGKSRLVRVSRHQIMEYLR